MEMCQQVENMLVPGDKIKGGIGNEEEMFAFIC